MQFESLKDKVLVSLAAIAGNGSIAGWYTSPNRLDPSSWLTPAMKTVYDGDAVSQYQSVLHFRKGEAQRIFPSLCDVSQLVAYETGFAALSSTGQVWTWGDERYEACLSREVSDAR